MAKASPPSTHPLLPPRTEGDRFDWLRLLRSRRVGVATFYRLMSEYGSARAALEALPQIAATAGVSDYKVCPERVIETELSLARAKRARLVCHGEPGYPAPLYDLADAPPLFWAVGQVSLLRRPMIAVVGARNASSLGLRMARALAAGLGEAGHVVVSGLARGIDAEAHKAALASGTIAVMGGGVDVLYPQENAALAQDMPAANGLRISEQAMGLAPQARHFPARNRLISGLARAVVVVEAAAKSGSLITARTALDQGREVLAIPGHPFDARASGCNMLIRDGAVLVRGAEDVIEALGQTHDGRADARPSPEPAASTESEGAGQVRPKIDASAQDLHRQILERLGPSPVSEDQLLRDLARPAGQIAPLLTDLEIEGRIRRAPGGFLALVAS